MNNLIAEQHWAVAMAETICIEGCTCIFCSRRSDADARANRIRTTPTPHPQRCVHRSLPSTSSIMEVLYPSSYLGTPSAFPDPPSYFSGDIYPSIPRRNHGERMENTLLISPTTTATGGSIASYGHHYTLVEAPSLTGVPSPGAPSGRVPPAEPNAPVVGLGIDILDADEPPPKYSRFDEIQPHLMASALLGPYPRISVFHHLRDERQSGSLETAKGDRSPIA